LPFSAFWIYIRNAALPFALSKDNAVRHVAPLVGTSKGRVGPLMTKYFPDFGSWPPPPNDLKAMYIPAWFIDGEATGMVTSLEVKVCRVEFVRGGHGLTPA